MFPAGKTLDEIIESARKINNPDFDAMVKEIIVNRALVGDEETEKWLFIQMRLNVMMNIWRKEK